MILTRLASTGDTAIIVLLAAFGIAGFIAVPILRHLKQRRTPIGADGRLAGNGNGNGRLSGRGGS